MLQSLSYEAIYFSYYVLKSDFRIWDIIWYFRDVGTKDTCDGFCIAGKGKNINLKAKFRNWNKPEKIEYFVLTLVN